MNSNPIRVAVTGAAGQIGYALLFRIASGAMFGPQQPVVLHLIEIPDDKAMAALNGVCMELEDGAFPLLKGVVATSSLDEGFRDVNWALLVGAVPRKQGMERKDLLGINGKIFTGQGQAIAKNAAPDVRTLVIGNPCNTNALIALNNAKGISADRFFAMTMLDENRAKSQLARKAGVDHPATRRRHHQGPRPQQRRQRRQRHCRYRPQPHHSHARRPVVQCRRLQPRRLWNRKGPHLQLPHPQQRIAVANCRRPAPQRIQPIQDRRD
jgi:hypothetical protein